MVHFSEMTLRPGGRCGHSPIARLSPLNRPVVRLRVRDTTTSERKAG